MHTLRVSILAHDHVVRSYDDSVSVKEFGKRFFLVKYMFTVLTILQVNLNIKVTCGDLMAEIEHVDVGTLENLERQGVDCEPKASTIRIIQVSLYIL